MLGKCGFEKLEFGSPVAAKNQVVVDRIVVDAFLAYFHGLLVQISMDKVF